MSRTPNIFHAWVLDTDSVWIDVFGNEHDTDAIDRDYAENILTFLLDNAQRFHRAYRETEEGIDPSGLALGSAAWCRFYDESNEHARRWMLRTELVRSLMRRLSEEEA